MLPYRSQLSVRVNFDLEPSDDVERLEAFSTYGRPWACLSVLRILGLVVLLDLIAVAAVLIAAVRVDLDLEPGDDVERLEDHCKSGDEDRQHQLPEDHLVGREPRLQPFDPAELALQVGFDLLKWTRNSVPVRLSATVTDLHGAHMAAASVAQAERHVVKEARLHLEVDLRVQRRMDPLHRLEDPGRRRALAEATTELRDGHHDFARRISPGVPARDVTFKSFCFIGGVFGSFGTAQPNLQVKINL